MGISFLQFSIRKPLHGLFRRRSGGDFIVENARAVSRRAGPSPRVFRVAAKLLETESPVRSAEQIDATGAVSVFQRGQNQGTGRRGKDRHAANYGAAPFFRQTLLALPIFSGSPMVTTRPAVG